MFVVIKIRNLDIFVVIKIHNLDGPKFLYRIVTDRPLYCINGSREY